MVAHEFQVEYHVEHIGRLLRSLRMDSAEAEASRPRARHEHIRSLVRTVWPRVEDNAKQLNAWIVFLDETGFLTMPLVCRTWVPRGQTPVLRESRRKKEKATVVAALAISPARHRARLLFSCPRMRASARPG